MKQVWIARRGGPKVLEVRETAAVPPGPGEVRVRVAAAGVNFADALARMGLYPDAPALPCVVGYEVAGIIDAVGPGVLAQRAGERVVALTRFGGYSEAVCVPSAVALPLPARLSFAQGAALPVQWLTAWHLLVELSNVRAGQKVLVHGVAGGVGLAALQICRRVGATVYGTASASKHARLRELGVALPIDGRTEDFEEVVRRETKGRGVDIVLDPVGGRSFKKSFRALAPAGRLVLYGASAMAPEGGRRRLWPAVRTLFQMTPFWPVPLLNSNKGIFGVNLGRLWDEQDLLRGQLAQILRGVEDGDFTPLVDSEVPFSEARRAHERLHARANVGKIVLVPG